MRGQPELSPFATTPIGDMRMMKLIDSEMPPIGLIIFSSLFFLKLVVMFIRRYQFLIEYEYEFLALFYIIKKPVKILTISVGRLSI